jgi:hypothetical protein
MAQVPGVKSGEGLGEVDGGLGKIDRVIVWGVAEGRLINEGLDSAGGRRRHSGGVPRRIGEQRGMGVRVGMDLGNGFSE